MMELQSLRPMLWVKDVQETINYYVTHLLFPQSHYEPTVDWGYVRSGKVEIMFAAMKSFRSDQNSQFTGSLYLNTNVVDEWWEKLKNTTEIFYPIETFNYGMREFAIKDCNGYILQFGQVINEH